MEAPAAAVETAATATTETASPTAMETAATATTETTSPTAMETATTSVKAPATAVRTPSTPAMTSTALGEHWNRSNSQGKESNDRKTESAHNVYLPWNAGFNVAHPWDKLLIKQMQVNCQRRDLALEFITSLL